MPATKSRQHAFTFDDALAKGLNQRMRAADLPVQPVRVGYRLLPDYFGDDVVNVLIVLPKDFVAEQILEGVLSPVNRLIWDWMYEEFPNWLPLVSTEIENS